MTKVPVLCGPSAYDHRARMLEPRSAGIACVRLILRLGSLRVPIDLSLAPEDELAVAIEVAEGEALDDVHLGKPIVTPATGTDKFHLTMFHTVRDVPAYGRYAGTRHEIDKVTFLIHFHEIYQSATLPCEEAKGEVGGQPELCIGTATRTVFGTEMVLSSTWCVLTNSMNALTHASQSSSNSRTSR